jgi:hypothetical protein
MSSVLCSCLACFRLHLQPRETCRPRTPHTIEKQAKSIKQKLDSLAALPSKSRRYSLSDASQDDTTRLEEVAEGMCTMQETPGKGVYAHTGPWLPNIAESFAELVL